MPVFWKYERKSGDSRPSTCIFGVQEAYLSIQFVVLTLYDGQGKQRSPKTRMRTEFDRSTIASTSTTTHLAVLHGGAAQRVVELRDLVRRHALLVLAGLAPQPKVQIPLQAAAPVLALGRRGQEDIGIARV